MTDKNILISTAMNALGMRKLIQAGAIAIVMASGFFGSAMSRELRCLVTEKLGTSEGTFSSYPPESIKKYSYSVIIRDRGSNGSELGRCSYSTPAKRVTCDFYAVDHIYRDSYLGGVKYYYFKGQFDVQVFPSMEFIENNGRGGLATGKCEVIN